MARLTNLTWRDYATALHDAATAALALMLAAYLVLEEPEFAKRLPLLLKVLPFFVLFSVIVCFFFRLPFSKWRFTSLPDVLAIIQASTVLAGALLVLDYILLAPNVLGMFFLGKKTIFIYWVLQIGFLAGSRLAYRYYRYARTRSRARNVNATPVLLVGHAADAEVLLRSIESGAVRNIWPSGILSPSPADRGRHIRGIAVLGDIGDLEAVFADFAVRGRRINRVIITPSALLEEAQPGSLLVRARRLGLLVNRLPSLSEGEQPRLAPVAVEDLLLRPTATIDYAELRRLVSGRSILVTGGGGSIGAEICDRVLTFGATRLLILENSEPALHAVLEGLAAKNLGHTLVDGRIADVRERDRMFRLIGAFQPDIVFHAAALKHVPLLERDWTEGVKTNVLGSVNVVDATVAAGATALVMISTDKAIEPVSMLGVTKRLAEMYCHALDRELARKADGAVATRLISVRFGNVLASTGSVVPKFKAQIEAGGPVTVTHPDMVRYFMTIREACDLVVTAARHALSAPNRDDASIYVLNMGRPVRIVELAERMIRLSGAEPDADIKIVFTGIRPGERLNEALFAHEEEMTDIGVSGVMAARPLPPDLDTLREWLDTLAGAVRDEDRRFLQTIFDRVAPSLSKPAQDFAHTGADRATVRPMPRLVK